MRQHSPVSLYFFVVLYLIILNKVVFLHKIGNHVRFINNNYNHYEKNPILFVYCCRCAWR